VPPACNEILPDGENTSSPGATARFQAVILRRGFGRFSSQRDVVPDCRVFPRCIGKTILPDKTLSVCTSNRSPHQRCIRLGSLRALSRERRVCASSPRMRAGGNN
jgi:hypothetical protein